MALEMRRIFNAGGSKKHMACTLLPASSTSASFLPLSLLLKPRHAGSAAINAHLFQQSTPRWSTRWPCKALPPRSSKPRSSKPDPLQNWQGIILALSGFGFLLGPLLDCIHSSVGLQIYKNGGIDVYSLHTNIVVPPLLAVFYSVVGLVQLALNKYLGHQDRFPYPSLRRLFLSFLSLVGIVVVSAVMYKAGISDSIEFYALLALSTLNWSIFDGTWWGFAFSVMVSMACPLAEVPFMKLFDVWYYPKANLYIFDEGLVTWVFLCYFSYTPFLANLSSWLSFQLQLLAESSQDGD